MSNNQRDDQQSAEGPRQPRTWERRLSEAKRKHRPKLKDWGKDEFATRRSLDFQTLGRFDPNFVTVQRISELRERKMAADEGSLVMHDIHRVEYDNLSYENFVEYFERPAIPCIIGGIPFSEEWRAQGAWTSWESFRPVRERYFKVGEDDDGYSVKVRAGNVYWSQFFLLLFFVAINTRVNSVLLNI